MDRELYQCTAGDLATAPVGTLSAETTVTDAVEWTSENGYQLIPVTVSLRHWTLASASGN